METLLTAEGARDQDHISAGCVDLLGLHTQPALSESAHWRVPCCHAVAAYLGDSASPPVSAYEAERWFTQVTGQVSHIRTERKAVLISSWLALICWPSKPKIL